MWRMLVILAAFLFTNEIHGRTISKDLFLEKLDQEFHGYNGRPMPPEISEMELKHIENNDDFEDCMQEFAECICVHKFYAACAMPLKVKQPTFRIFPNICEFEYRNCMDGENSWRLVEESFCGNITNSDITKFSVEPVENMTHRLEMNKMESVAKPESEVVGNPAGAVAQPAAEKDAAAAIELPAGPAAESPTPPAVESSLEPEAVPTKIPLESLVVHQTKETASEPAAQASAEAVRAAIPTAKPAALPSAAVKLVEAGAEVSAAAQTVVLRAVPALQPVAGRVATTLRKSPLVGPGAGPAVPRPKLGPVPLVVDTIDAYDIIS